MTATPPLGVAFDGCDFLDVARVPAITRACRPGHKFGDVMLTGVVRGIFGRRTRDRLPGYEMLPRRFVESFSAMSRGFETELTVHAPEMHGSMAELSAPYEPHKERHEGSTGELRTFRGGWRSLMLISRLVEDERPLTSFASVGGLFPLPGLPVVVECSQTGLVPRLPAAVSSAVFIVRAAPSAFAGLTLDVVTKARQELERAAHPSLARS